MSVRRAEFARLEAAGWTVMVDSPWRRLGAAVARMVGRPVDTHGSMTRRAGAGPAAGAAGWAGPVGWWSR